MVMMNGKEFFFKDYLQTLIYNNGKYISRVFEKYWYVYFWDLFNSNTFLIYKKCKDKVA